MPFFSSPADTFSQHISNIPQEADDLHNPALPKQTGDNAAADLQGSTFNGFASDTLDTSALTTTHRSGVGYGQLDPMEFASSSNTSNDGWF